MSKPVVMERSSWRSPRGEGATPPTTIVRLVAENPAPRSITVVTSDDLLAQRVRALGAGAMSAMTFRNRLDETIRTGGR
jgi:predicted RNA-binding protein with PIN domain